MRLYRLQYRKKLTEVLFLMKKQPSIPEQPYQIRRPKKQEKLCCYFRFSKKLSERSVRYLQEEIRKFDKSLPIKEWLKIRPATDKKSLLRK